MTRRLAYWVQITFPKALLTWIDILDTAGQEEYSAMRLAASRTFGSPSQGPVHANRSRVHLGVRHHLPLFFRRDSQLPRADPPSEGQGQSPDDSRRKQVRLGDRKVKPLPVPFWFDRSRQVTTGEGQDLAKSFTCPFFESSAKTRVNVEEVILGFSPASDAFSQSFYELVREIRKEVQGEVKGKKPKKRPGFFISRKDCIVL